MPTAPVAAAIPSAAAGSGEVGVQTMVEGLKLGLPTTRKLAGLLVPAGVVTVSL